MRKREKRKFTRFAARYTIGSKRQVLNEGEARCARLTKLEACDRLVCVYAV